MTELPITRQEAIEFLKSFSQEKSDMNHYLESEAIMKGLAKHFKENENYWAMIGLLHDVDWSQTKIDTSTHLSIAPKLLNSLGFNEEFINTIISHGYGFDEIPELKDKTRKKKIEHSLAAAETLTGLIYAYALMRNKNISTMEVKGLKKKFKDKKFAEKCSREIIKEIEKTDLELNEFFQIAIDSMKEIKEEIGLE